MCRALKRRFGFPLLLAVGFIGWLLLFIYTSFNSRNINHGRQGKQKSAFIAILLYQNEEILSQFTENLLTILPHFSSTFISIYENGSTDRTKEMLKKLKVLLAIRQIPHLIITDDEPHSFNNRIEYLAGLRNKALQPLFSNSTTVTYDKLIFFNDILYDPHRFLEMFDRLDGKYDAICGLDYAYKFYDTFATREEMVTNLPNDEDDDDKRRQLGGLHDDDDDKRRQLGGLQPSPWMPLFYDSSRQSLMRSGQLTPVFSCWNGVAVFSTTPFYRHQVRFRALPRPAVGQYAASECCLIFSDFHRLGYGKVFVDPRFIARYRRQTLLEWIVYQWEWVWYYLLLYRPRLPADVSRYFEAIHKQGRLNGLDPFDLTCIQ